MKKDILVITPSFFGGSWVCVSRILEELKNKKIFVVGMGSDFSRNSKYKYLTFPYPRYDKWGHFFASIPLLSFIWSIPLIIISAISLLIIRPRVVITNGFSPAMVISPFAFLLKIKVIVIHNGFIGNHLSGLTLKLVKYIARLIDLVIVNSKGSFVDIKQIINPRKIIINEHYADNIFFKSYKNSRKKSNELTVLYIGRLDRDKLLEPLIDIALKLKDNKNFLFIFAGTGEFQARIQALSDNSSSVKYLGYVEDRNKLKDLYASSNVLWSYADETYLSLPAIEALSCGRPIIVPILSALPERAALGVEVDKSLVPSKIGWFVDTKDFKACYELICSLGKNGIKLSMEKECYEYAKLHYSSRNLDKTVSRILSHI